jgi:hypothetical protein
MVQETREVVLTSSPLGEPFFQQPTQYRRSQPLASSKVVLEHSIRGGALASDSRHLFMSGDLIGFALEWQ